MTGDRLSKTGLPPDRTHGDALARAAARRKFLWRECASWDEDERIDALVAYCTRLYGGDAKAGEQLATDAIWS